MFCTVHVEVKVPERDKTNTKTFSKKDKKNYMLSVAGEEARDVNKLLTITLEAQ